VDEVELAFMGIQSVPKDLIAQLVDEELGISIDLRENRAYQFYAGKRKLVTRDTDARFKLIIGDETFVAQSRLPRLPSSTRLYQNYPNPFNPSTIIRYAIAEPSNVTVRVYNARGALVRRLFNGKRDPGVYEIPWDARNDEGRAVASGVYFYRLDAGDVTNTRKMLLLK
jgi:hypothetical protein